MRVLVTGSRTWRNNAVSRELTIALLGRTSSPFVVVHGDAPSGADRLAADWAAENAILGNPVEAEPHPANWRNGRQAGWVRNAEMIAAGADLCLAFINPCAIGGCKRLPRPHGTHGATHCADLAEAAGIPTRRIYGGTTAKTVLEEKDWPCAAWG